MDIKLINDGKFVFKSDGEKPEEFTPYLVAYKTKTGNLNSMVGIFEPDYDHGNGGFYDGMMAHLDFEHAYAWMSLGNIKLIEED